MKKKPTLANATTLLLIKKILFIFFIVLIFEGKAQSNFIIAGQHGTIYYDIVPDTLLQFTSPTSYGPDQTYNIDINQDGINDIQIISHDQTTSGSSDFHRSVSALNSNTSFSYGGQNSTGTCQNVKLLKPFYAGDTIQNNTTYVSLGYISYSSYIVPGGGGCSSQGNWGDTGDVYIGVKYQVNTSTAYGWIKVNAGSNSILIKEYSLGAFITGVKKIENNYLQFLIYPNPVKDILNIELEQLNEKVDIKITDVLGSEVICTTQKQIDVSTLQNGIYFVQVKTSEGRFGKKIIIKE